MKVLTSDAVQDPTRVEARVRREVAMRKHQHEKANTERKLTDEERREKIETKKAEEDKKGIYGAVFKYVCFYSFLLFVLWPNLCSYFFFTGTGSTNCMILRISSKSVGTPNR